MPKKLHLILPPLIAVLLLGYRSELSSAFSKPLLGYNAYMIFTAEIKSFILFFSLSILLSVIFPPVADQKNGGNKFWYLGFFAVFLFAGAMVIYANPQGRFPWDTHADYVELEVRARKFDLYKKLERTPGVILLGSSVSLLEPTTYFEEKWGQQAFNLSVDKGGPIDFVNQLNVVKEKSPDANMPLVVMAEMLDLSLALNYYEKTPIEYIPYMDSIKQQSWAAWMTVSDVFDFHSFSDSLFTLFIIDKGRWKSTSTITPSGTMIRNVKDVKDNEYRKLVTKNIRLLSSLQTCESLNEGGKAAVERLVQLSRQYKFSLLFYRTPINQDFYAFSNTAPSDYSQCSLLFNQYIEGIAAQNPNVFFKDLSQYKEIATGGKDLYIDTHHLTTKGSLMMLDALSAEIEQALQWAKENRP